MMEVNLGEMLRIKFNHRRVVGIDSESSGYDTDEEDRVNADDDCEHVICHRVDCKVDPSRSARGGQSLLHWKDKAEQRVERPSEEDQ